MDNVGVEVRRRMMQSVGSKDTAPELGLRKALHGRGWRYRLHCRNLPGTPDIVFRKAKVAVFVHGCFWHRHPGCSRSTSPKTREAFWAAKFRANVDRDRRKERELEASGWSTIVAWECEIAAELDAVVRRVEACVRRGTAR